MCGTGCCGLATSWWCSVKDGSSFSTLMMLQLCDNPVFYLILKNNDLLAVPVQSGWVSPAGEAVGDAHRPISHGHRAGLCPAHPTPLPVLPCTVPGSALSHVLEQDWCSLWDWGWFQQVGHCCSSWEDVERRVLTVWVRLYPVSPGEWDSREWQLASSWFW